MFPAGFRHAAVCVWCGDVGVGGEETCLTACVDAVSWHTTQVDTVQISGSTVVRCGAVGLVVRLELDALLVEIQPICVRYTRELFVKLYAC